MLIADGWGELETCVKTMAADAKRVVFVPNQGNAGDALIAAGTWQFFEDCRLNPKIVRRGGLRRGDTALYAGGGNLVPEYSNCERFLRRCLKIGIREALILPHTILGHEALLRELDNRFVLVCRDFASLQRVRSSGTNARIMMAPDMALRIDTARLFARCSEPRARAALLRDLLTSFKLLDYLRWRRRLARLGAPLTGHMFEVIRTDVEATGEAVGSPERDVSNFYGSKFQSRAEAERIACDLLTFFSQASHVVTNRLHVGVAAALMGSKVSYLDNSYGKIRAVFEASMLGVPGMRFGLALP